MSKITSIDSSGGMVAPPIIVSQPAKTTTGRGGTSWWRWVAFGSLGVALALLFFFDPNHARFYPRCNFYVLTGWQCPGCGGLRATHELLHGNLLAALHDNALYVLSLPLFGFYLVRWGLNRLHQRPTKFSLTNRQLIAVFVAMTVFTILRNIPAAPFNYLAPLH